MPPRHLACACCCTLPYFSLMIQKPLQDQDSQCVQRLQVPTSYTRDSHREFSPFHLRNRGWECSVNHSSGHRYQVFSRTIYLNFQHVEVQVYRIARNPQVRDQIARHRLDHAGCSDYGGTLSLQSMMPRGELREFPASPATR